MNIFELLLLCLPHWLHFITAAACCLFLSFVVLIHAAPLGFGEITSVLDFEPVKVAKVYSSDNLLLIGNVDNVNLSFLRI